MPDICKIPGDNPYPAPDKMALIELITYQSRLDYAQAHDAAKIGHGYPASMAGVITGGNVGDDVINIWSFNGLAISAVIQVAISPTDPAPDLTRKFIATALPVGVGDPLKYQGPRWNSGIPAPIGSQVNFDAGYYSAVLIQAKAGDLVYLSYNLIDPLEQDIFPPLRLPASILNLRVTNKQFHYVVAPPFTGYQNDQTTLAWTYTGPTINGFYLYRADQLAPPYTWAKIATVSPFIYPPGNFVYFDTAPYSLTAGVSYKVAAFNDMGEVDSNIIINQVIA